jgi:hypothetical protein
VRRLLIATLAATISVGGYQGVCPLKSTALKGTDPLAMPRVVRPPRVFAFVSSHGGAEIERLARVGARIDVVAPNW